MSIGSAWWTTRLLIVKLMCWALLPKNLWVGKHFGAYTQQWSIHFGWIDARGVVQGYDPKKGER